MIRRSLDDLDFDLNCWHAVQVTKDGATYNIDYSTTIYGYNAITVRTKLAEGSECMRNYHQTSQRGAKSSTVLYQCTVRYCRIHTGHRAVLVGTICAPFWSEQASYLLEPLRPPYTCRNPPARLSPTTKELPMEPSPSHLCGTATHPTGQE